MVNNEYAAVEALRALIDALNGTDVETLDEDWVTFFVYEDVYLVANVVTASGRLRIRAYLPSDDEQLVNEWIASQSAPRSGVLEKSYIHEGDWRPRLLFERPITSIDWATDPLLADITQYAAEWLEESTGRYTSGTRPPYVIQEDPREIAPSSAWLLIGSEASFPSSTNLQDDKAAADVGIFKWDWTAAPQTQIGDLVLFYFTSPRKAVHFVARAASKAFFTRDIEVVADKSVNSAQWWAYFTNPIAIDPIPVDVLRQAVGGHLLLRGRSGQFLRPGSVAALQFRASEPSDQAELDRIVEVPAGIADLPDPNDITPEVWRELAAGALRFEDDVSSHVVEPLLGFMLAGTGLEWKGEYRIERRSADFVVLDGKHPLYVIEVKRAIKDGSGGRWDKSPDFTQLRWYADHLGTAGMLIDSNRLLLVDNGAAQPLREIQRRDCSDTDLRAIREHILKARVVPPG
ncbi:hypothetical protein C6I20_02835 [Aeromicrobium sp. A1-2]|uniref:hypothetical protein n=1 Tax=Aeromicrobium sp. A1-2 TaxID=2107713 RepID=UPI000E47A199|nr:hypothetical protein [Aeromicrobium sp. A1-2]AXT84231.1 hypothetical protein C6I20_02835 [Aeromicrobium sp. A1-2]